MFLAAFWETLTICMFFFLRPALKSYHPYLKFWPFYLITVKHWKVQRVSCLIRLSTWLAFLVPRPHYCARQMPFGSCGPSEFVHVSFVSASSPKCIVREGLGSISHSLFGNFRAEIVAFHIIQPPHDFRTEDCPCSRKTLQLCSQSKTNQLHFTA